MATGGTDKGFKLVTPDHVVEYNEGDVTLRCHLSPETSAVAMEIRGEGLQYEGRVSVDPQQLQRGDVSLTLRRSRGEYKGVRSSEDTRVGNQTPAFGAGAGTRTGVDPGTEAGTEERGAAAVTHTQMLFRNVCIKKWRGSAGLGGGGVISTLKKITAEERKNMEESVQSLGANKQEEDNKQLEDTLRILEMELDELMLKNDREHQAGAVLVLVRRSRCLSLRRGNQCPEPGLHLIYTSSANSVDCLQTAIQPILWQDRGMNSRLHLLLFQP
ncbi:uncharacterized protein LOC125292260 [Alosa alosa]|uniref:uncharacterized protein LOC125292260 n=1 Tax=Alosa alosa TaxID=278164 RepID=UPI00201549FF|nr:uncharacterized protein LOC125292260 [Alosa alosa]